MTTRQKITFAGNKGVQLAGSLELPAGQPKAYALFAHCFSCGKDISAASRIARWLAAKGIAVLRFDFTGLGQSEGDFGNSGFSGNVADLVAAAAWLRDQHQAPSLLVGHSLGGAAVLAAGPKIPECKAIATIGAPAEPSHALHLLGNLPSQLAPDDRIDITLGGREFVLSGSFVNDLRTQQLLQTVPKLKIPLLVMHAPLDDVVGVDQAAQLFTAAKHPKSFVSLDDADHLLTRLQDAQYVATTISAWASRYLPQPPTLPTVPRGELLVQEVNHKFLRQMISDNHAWLSDEPRAMGGQDLGPDPYEHLLAALGACTSMTLRMYANRKNWPLTDVDVGLSHTRQHKDDCESCTDGASSGDHTGAKIEVLTRRIALYGPLSDEQRARLLQIADRCPVHRTLEADLNIATELEPLANSG